MQPLDANALAGTPREPFGDEMTTAAGVRKDSLLVWVGGSTSVLAPPPRSRAGVGLTLPTIVASAISEPHPENFATGSAVVNMLRQVGLAIGVAMLIAVLGTHSGAHAVLDAFQHSWLVIGALAAATAHASVAILGVRRPTRPLVPYRHRHPARGTRRPRRGRLAHPPQHESPRRQQ